MPNFGQLVLGPPGSGKTTYCYGLQQFFNATKRPITVVNLDPACPNPPYQADISIASLITLEDVMSEFTLGPNGGMLYCLEFLEANFDWLEDELNKHKTGYFVFDLPGQVELSTDHMSLRRIVARLEKLGYQLAAVHLTDAHHITDASKFISVLLLSLRTMLQMELPHINVLSKIDLLSSYGELPFRLNYYTEVQDLSFLDDILDQDASSHRAKKFAGLTKAIRDVVEDFGLVGYETLCVEDKTSMAILVKKVDQALGCVPPATDPEDEAMDYSQFFRPIDAALQQVDAHERWIESKDVYDEYDRKGWAREGELVQKEQG